MAVKVQKTIILQKKEIRYTAEKIKSDEAVDYYRITKETFGSESPRTFFRSVSAGEADIRDMLKYEYFMFRHPEEVSWYATVKNDTGYKEKWKRSGGFFVPIDSYSAKRFYLNGDTYKMLDAWSKKAYTEQISYRIGKNLFAETPCFVADITSQKPEYKQVTLQYEQMPLRRQVEEDYISHQFRAELDRIREEYGIE